MPLPQLIRHQADDLLREWEHNVAACAAPEGTSGGAPPALLRHLLDCLVDTVEAMSRGSWRLSAFDDVELRALAHLAEATPLGQLVTWLSLLRPALVERVWQRGPARHIEELHVVGKALDETVRRAVAADALVRRQQQAEAARAESERVLQSRNEMLEVLDLSYEAAPVGLALFDLELRYVRINATLARINGLPAAAHIGKRLSELFSEIAETPTFEGALRRVLETGEAIKDMETSAVTPEFPGKRRYWLNNWYPLRTGGKTVGLGVMVQEITAQRLVEQERAELFRREQAARGEAQAATRAKDEFLAVLSHELRTPLQSMLGWIQMVQRPELDPSTARKGLETIERNVRLQQQLIEDLLDVSRIVTGKLHVDRQPFDLGGVVEAAVAAAKTAADAKGIQLDAAIAPGAGEVLGDAHRLQQVVSNLLTNAVKFTPRRGRVGVRLQLDRAAARILVEDTGCGISAEVQPFVFERFRQAESTSTRSHGGLGLGLAIVRHLVELHGGTVTAASPGEGQGATFTVTLPLVYAELGAAAPALRSKPPPRPWDPTLLDGARILVVDDDPDACDLLKVVLHQCGAEVRAVRSARAAQGELATWKPHLLVSDLGMPEQDGYSLLRQMRAEEGGGERRVPAIALSAYANEEDCAQALAAGFDAHIAKPASPGDLARTIASLLGRAT